MLLIQANKIEAMIKGIVAEKASTQIDAMAPTDIGASYEDPLEKKFRDLENK